MDPLRLSHKFLTFSGVWIPNNWTSPRQKLTWLLYSTISNGQIIILFLGHIIHLLEAETWSLFMERIYLIPTGVAIIQKSFVYIRHQKELIDLNQMFLDDCCLPRNSKEADILNRYDRHNRHLTIVCAFLVYLTSIFMMCLPFLQSSEENALPIEVWLPNYIKKNWNYWLLYSVQFFTFLLVCSSAIGTTMIFIGFMHRVCGQFQLLSHRLYQLPVGTTILHTLKIPDDLIQRYEKEAVKHIIQHHVYIFRIAETINQVFKSVMLQHFCGSAIVLSFTVYQLSTKSGNDLETITILSYLACVLVEFLIYCWFGNEIILESSNFKDSVYCLSWAIPSTKIRKDLLLISVRCLRPIKMRCGYLIILSLSSYINILRISYSIFNILRRTS